MSKTKYVYPSDVNQTSGGKYRTFKDLKKIKSVSGYAVSNGLIHGKKSSPNRPSTITCTNFKANLPQGSEVSSITVEYKHSRIKANNGKDTPNITAPTIAITHDGQSSKKGTAPPKTVPEEFSRTFKYSNRLSANKVNSKDFGVTINYPANANDQEGYVRIFYVRLKITYIEAGYKLSLKRAGEHYNKMVYYLEASISNVNGVDYNPTIVITAPPGFTYLNWTSQDMDMYWGALQRKGMDKVTQTQPRVLTWQTANMKGYKTHTIELVFMVDITGTLPYNANFTAVEQLTSKTATLRDTIIAPPVNPETDTTTTDESYTSKTDVADLELKSVTLDEEFEYSFQIDDITWDNTIETIYNYGINEDWWDEYDPKEEIIAKILQNGEIDFRWGTLGNQLSKNEKIKWYDSDLSSWVATSLGVNFNTFLENEKTYTQTFKAFSLGYDEIECYVYYVDTDEEISEQIGNRLSAWKFDIRPAESSLTIPYLSLLTLNDEELHRLGDGYNYTIQSYMEVPSNATEYYEYTNVKQITYTSNPKYFVTKDNGTVQGLPTDFTWEFDFKTTNPNYSSYFWLASNYTENTIPTHYIGLGISDNKLACLSSSADAHIEGDAAESNTYYRMKLVKEGNYFSCYADGKFIGRFYEEWLDECETIYFVGFISMAGTLSYTNATIYHNATEYVRDWYKNFRIGVFNNPIISNVTNYMNWVTTETEQDQNLNINSMLDLTDATLTIEVDKAIDITIDEDTIQLADNDSETLSDLTEYNILGTFKKVTEDVVNLTTTLKDANDNIMEVRHYIIKFEQTETLEPYETSVDSTDYENLTTEEIFNNIDYWGNIPTNINRYDSISTNFTYNKNYPLYIAFTGDYNESGPSNTVKFTEPAIIESEGYDGWEQNGTFPIPIDDIILNDGSTSEWGLNTYQNGNQIVIYDLPVDEDFGTDTDMAIRGIEVSMDIEQTTQMVVYATLVNPDGQPGTRSIVIDENTEKLVFGGVGDLWNFSVLDLTKLSDWELKLETSNTLTEADGNLNFGNLEIIFYVEEIEPQLINCFVDGEDLRYYGVFLKNVKIPEGLETDVKYLDIDGTDTNAIQRQNIRQKTIDVEFSVDNCDLTTSTTMIRQLTQLLTNKRDKYNRPIPKRIEFTHYPDVYFEYVMTEALDNSIDLSGYEAKAKLVIPSGTAYKKENTVTSTVGFVQGLASVNPIITIKPSGENIEILETISNQKFNIDYNGDYADKIIEIDCEDRFVWLKTSVDDEDPVNISNYVNFNSDWFKLQGRYQFEGTNCIIRTVDYTERH